MKWTTILVLFILLTCPFASVLLAPNASAQTRGFRGSMDNAASFELEIPKANSLLWNFYTGDQIESTAVPFGNTVLFGANNGFLYSVDSLRGTEVWKVELGGQVMASPTITEDGIAYIGCTNHTFYAIDAGTGQVQWKWISPDPYSQIVSSAAVDGARAYFGSSDRLIHALNLTSHKEDWNFSVKADVWSSPALYGERVYIGTLDGNIYSLWRNNGTLAWNFSSPTYEGIYASPAVAQNKVIYITGLAENAIYALNATTGKVDWRFQAPGPGYGSAAIHGDTVYIPTWDQPNAGGWLWALPLNDPTPGDGVLDRSAARWSAYTGDVQGGSSPIYSKGKILVGSDDGMGGEGKLRCINATNGKELWNLTTGGDVYSTPAVSEGIAYIGSMDGRMYAVGGDPSAKMVIKVLPEATELQGGHVVGIGFMVTFRGLPLEGAFVKINVTAGELSQNGASTFPDGHQRVKYQAPKVSVQTTITFSADATFFGIEPAHGFANITIIPASVYKIKSSNSFALSNYYLYIILVVILIAVNVTIVVLGRRIPKIPYDKPKEVPKDGR